MVITSLSSKVLNEAAWASYCQPTSVTHEQNQILIEIVMAIMRYFPTRSPTGPLTSCIEPCPTCEPPHARHTSPATPEAFYPPPQARSSAATGRKVEAVNSLG